MAKKLLFLLPLFVLIFASCSEEYDTSVFDSAKVKGETNSVATYIEIFPQWDNLGLNRPQALLYGNETLLFICDTGNDRVLMINSAGTILGQLPVKRPIAIAQDYKLNLYICGRDTFKTVDTSGVTRVDTVSAVFKVDLYAVQHKLNANTPVLRVLPDRKVAISLDLSLEYTAVCAFYDNSVYIARQGAKNTKEPPDNSFLVYRKYADTSRTNDYIERVPGLEALGKGFRSINKVTSLTSFKKKNMDFIVTTTWDEASFRAQWLYLNTSSENQKFESKLPVSSEMMEPRRFGTPMQSCVDNKQNMYVVDSAKDSVFKYNNYGEEMESFGGPKYGFKSPMGVAFYDKTVYVADTYNNKIRRFRLSSELR